MQKRNLSLGLVGSVLALALGTPASASSDKDIDTIGSAIMARQYGDAASQIEALSRKGGADAALLINLGNAYAGMGKYDNARAAYKAAMIASPDMELEMADGSVRIVRDIAADGIRRLNTTYASR